MLPFSYRYNRFSQSYLINFNNYEFEAEPDLFEILTSYYKYKDYDLATQELSKKNIFINQDNLQELITTIEQSRHQFSPELRSRTFKVLDFSFCNRFLDHTLLTWTLIFLFVWFTFIHSPLLTQFFVLPKASDYTFGNILFIVPIYYLSRLLFTPVHEFGHYLFYYLFTKKSASFYIQFPGFMYFAGITTTDDLFYIKNPLKRIIISLAGIGFEFILLVILLVVLQHRINPFFLQLLTVRVFLSAFFNLNFLSQSTDGHILITDLLGFTTFSESYSDFLRTVLNKQFEPAVPINNRTKKLFIVYSIIGIVLIGLLLVTQVLFFEHIVELLVMPLTKVSFTQQLTLIDYGLLLLTYLYYLDLLVRFYAKRVILTKIGKIRRNEQLL